jgi:tetratricopeptide (TPR) repeat protein
MNSRTLFLGVISLFFLFSCSTEVEYIEKGEIDKAVDYCNSAKVEEQAICYQHVADYYYDNKEYENAAEFYEKTGNEDFKDEIDSCMKEIVAKNYIDKDTKLETLEVYANSITNEETKIIYFNYLGYKLILDERIENAAKIYYKAENVYAVHFIARHYVKNSMFEEGKTLFSDLGDDENIQFITTAEENLPATIKKLDKPISDFVYSRIDEDKLVERIAIVLAEVDYVEDVDLLTVLVSKYSIDMTDELMRSLEGDLLNYNSRPLDIIQVKFDVAVILLNVQKETDAALMAEITKLVTGN